MDKGTPPDFGYLAAVAAAAAVRLGIPFELDVPVRDGRVPLPGLGCLTGLEPGRMDPAEQRRRRLRAGERHRPGLRRPRSR